MKRSILALISTVLVSNSVAAQSGADRKIVAEIDRFADSVIKSVPVAGMSIVVSRGSEIIVSKGYGVADLETGRRMTASRCSSRQCCLQESAQITAWAYDSAQSLVIQNSGTQDRRGVLALLQRTIRSIRLQSSC